MLVDEGLLRDSSPISLPPTIQALLAARLDRLGREDRAVLERGSVEGKVFHRGAVAELSPPDERPLVGERLSRLLEREFLRPGQPGLRRRAGLPLSPPAASRRRLRLVAQDDSGRSSTSGSPAGSKPRLPIATQEFDEILGYHLQQAFTFRSDLGPVDERARALAARAGDHLGSAGSRAYARGDVAGTRTLLARALTLMSERRRRSGGPCAEARRCPLRARGVQEATAESHVVALLSGAGRSVIRGR